MLKQKIVPCLWFNHEAEEAARYYVSVFPNSKITHSEPYAVDTPSEKPIGSVMLVTFELDGNAFLALNGGAHFKLSEAVSFMIYCENQKEVDYYYDKLSHDPKAEVCGWLKDKFGLSWQIIPKDYDDLMSGLSSEQKKNAMTSLLQMKRIDVNKLRESAGATGK